MPKFREPFGHTAPAELMQNTQERLAALWALRLALTPAGSQRFLKPRSDADDLLVIIGPWIDWPKGMRNLFAQRLAKYSDDAWDSTEDDPGDAENQSTPAVKNIDWRSVDWRDLSGAFSTLCGQHPARVTKLLQVTINRLQAQPLDREDPLLINLDRLSQVLNLNEEEQSVLLFLAVTAEHMGLRVLFRAFAFQGMARVCTLLASLLDLPVASLRSILRPGGALQRNGLISPSRHASDLEDVFKLDDALQRAITQPHDSVESLMAQFLEVSRPGELQASDYAHLCSAHGDASTLLAAALGQRQPGVNVLLYGAPGTGKTEFARLLAKGLGVDLYAVKTRDEDGDPADADGRMTHYQLAQNFLRDNPKALLLFDEVEDVLGGESGLSALSRLFGGSNSGNNSRKAWLNQVLETNPVPTIWISNSIEAFDPAFLRRFLYPVEFALPPRSVRRRMVDRHLGEAHVSEPWRERLAGEPISPAQLDTLARVVGLVQPALTSDTEALLTRTLKAGMRVLGQESVSGKASVTDYRLDFLNIDSRIPLERLVAAAGRGQPLSLCLAGPPGTGKTQLAHYLARQIDRPLLAKRASDILDKFLGGTERNLARIFNEARDENAVLLLDEADSLLQNRALAERSWEVTQVNELLQQMESFEGLFICATNRFEHLDPASLRRFTAKLAFDYLTPRQRWFLFLQESGLATDQTYADLRPLRRRLDRLDTLTPGDYATVKRQFIALGETPNAEAFVSQLEDEIRLKDIHGQRRAIGFVH